MKNKLLAIKDKIKRFFQHEYVVAFLTLYLVGVLAFSIVASGNSFTLPLYGDYNLQTYAFYTQGYNIFWDFIKTGEFRMFDFSNFLGANLLGTQSFYYLFSPLFYLLCLWPKAFLYQGIFFHMVFKFTLGGFFFYILLRRYFQISKKIAWAGAFAYALSGWSLFYLWFHFGDVVSFFPLFLMGMERLLKERKGGLLTLSLMLIALANYFFVVNFAIFGVFYALFRWVYIYGLTNKRGYSAKVRWGTLLQGILFYAAGLLLAGVVLLPALYVVQQSSRTTSSYLIRFLSSFFVNPGYVDGELSFGTLKSFSSLFSLDAGIRKFQHFFSVTTWDHPELEKLLKTLFVWSERKLGTQVISSEQHIGYILASWLVMSTNCWNSTMFNVSSLDNSIGGMFITTPLTILLIPSILQAFKTKRPWTIFTILFVIIATFMPFTAHLSFAFTGLYGRWQIWIVAIGIIFIIQSLDKFEQMDRRFVTLGLIVNYALVYLTYQMSKKNGMTPISDYQTIILLEVVIMGIVWFIYRFRLFKPAIVKKAMIFIMVIEVGISTVVTVEHKGYYKWDSYFFSQESFDEMKEVIADLQEEDPSFYRLYNAEATRSFVNLPSTLDYNGSSTFNSTYDFELKDFIRRSRVWYSGSWSMGIHEKRYYLDQYIGTKYYIVRKNDKNNDNGDYAKDVTTFYDGRTSKEEQQQDYSINLPFDYTLYKSYDYYDVYINNSNIGIGYTVDKYISSGATGTSNTSSYYEELYTQMAIVEEETYETLLQDDSLDVASRPVSDYESSASSSWEKYFSMREDYETDRIRKEHYLGTGSISQKDIEAILPKNSSFLHRRWEEKERFGDQFILKLVKNQTPLCPVATEGNKCYINMTFKMGPRVLISLYNGETLITQDAHMNCNASLGVDSNEWKLQRGFYVDQPIDKIVIEYIQDTPLNKAFQSNGLLRTISLNYLYEEEAHEVYRNLIDQHGLYDVTYKTDNFTFKTNETRNRIAVTNIPYDIGWSLKNTTTNQNIEIFKVNGGFIGFITPSGETSYHLSYFTPNLKKGILISLGGLFMYLVLAFIYRAQHIEIVAFETVIGTQYQKEREEAEEKEMKDTKLEIKHFFLRLKYQISVLLNKIKSLFHKKGE